MTTKTRKHIGLGALALAIAVVGVLAAFIVLANGPGVAQAHDPGNAAAHTAVCADDAARHDNLANLFSQPSCAEELGTGGNGGNGNGGNGGSGNGGNGNGTTPMPTPTRAPATTPATGSGNTVATGDELPGMVHNLMVVPHEEAVGGIPQEQLAVTWDPPTEGGVVSAYRIDLSLDGGNRWHSYMTSTDTRNLRVVYGDETNRETNEAPLKAGATRHFRVFAKNGQGFGPGMTASGTTAASWCPEPPSNVTAEMMNETTIRVNWTSPEDPPGAPVLRTVIEWSPDGQDPWFLVTDGVNPHPTKADGPYDDKSLISMTTRHYRVYAVNSVCERSPVSVNSDSAITDDSEVPDLPKAVEYILLSPNSSLVDLKWTAPANPAGDPVSRYVVQARLSASNAESDYKPLHTGPYVDAKDVADGYDFAETDLARAGITFNRTADDGTMVDLRLRAGNRAGYSADWLEIHNVPIGHAKLPRRQGDPSATQDRAQNKGRTGLNVEWPAAGFIKTYEPSGSGSDTYARKVSYVLSIDGKEEENGSSYRTGEMGDDKVTGNTRAHVGNADTVQMTDDDALAAGTTRKYQVYPVRDYGDLGVRASFRIDLGNKVQANVEHVLRGFPSRVVSAKTAAALLPGQPTDLEALAGGHTEIDLRWMEPKSAANCAAGDDGDRPREVRMGLPVRAGDENDGSECGPNVITGYRVEISEDPNLAPGSWHGLWPLLTMKGKSSMAPADWEVVGVTKPGSMTLASDLKPTEKAIWDVVSISYDDGSFDFLAPASWRGLQPLLAMPRPKSIMDVAFSEYLWLTEDSWVGLNRPGANRESVTVAKLTPDTRYYFRVFAENPTGMSRKAAEYDSTKTDVADPPTPPGGLVAQVEGSGVALCWFEHNKVDPLTGAAILDDALPIVGYKIVYLDADGKTEIVLEPDTGSTDTVYTHDMLLAEDAKRTYRVYSINLDGVGVEYAEASVTGGPVPNMAPMAEGTIADQTLKTTDTVPTPLDVADNFTDADGDALTYTVMSSDESVATVSNVGSALTITMVSAGETTITVTATDGEDASGMTATQTFTVTVELVLGKPTNVMAMVDGDSVTITWMNGASADVHWVHLLDLDDWSRLRSERIADLSVTSHTFLNVMPGTYLAIVESTLGDDYDYATQSGVTVQ